MLDGLWISLVSPRLPWYMPCYFNCRACYIIAELTYVFLISFFFAAQPRPMITPEQEDFLYRILTIPFEERLWKALVTLGTLHAFYDGLKPSPEA